MRSLEVVWDPNLNFQFRPKFPLLTLPDSSLRNPDSCFCLLNKILFLKFLATNIFISVFW